MWTRSDLEAKPVDRTPTSGLQRIYYLYEFTRGSGCGEMHVVEPTDHKGFLLDLYPTQALKRGAACR
ncbi:hypothetical protein [Actinoallomurus sp. CA-150999]|uniref:hypothetical protein n=1 Tax=Actinoallomurus sp. CA-150999 TaxID=3239887 RepID=UPI003D900F74